MEFPTPFRRAGVTAQRRDRWPTMQYWEIELFERAFADPTVVRALARQKAISPSAGEVDLMRAAIRSGELGDRAMADCGLLIDICTSQQRRGAGPSTGEYALKLREKIDLIKAEPEPEMSQEIASVSVSREEVATATAEAQHAPMPDIDRSQVRERERSPEADRRATTSLDGFSLTGGGGDGAAGYDSDSSYDSGDAGGET